MNLLKEDCSCYKIRNENLEKLIKEIEIKYQNDREELNGRIDSKTNFFNKEDIKKNQMIASLEKEIKTYKDELEHLMSADTLLQNRYRELLEKYHDKKQKFGEKIVENNKLSLALSKFEDKLKNIESTSIKDINSLKNEKNYLNTCHLEEMTSKDKECSEKIEGVIKDNIKKADDIISHYESELFKLKNELLKSKEECRKAFMYKEEEVMVLNDDRNKLQLALADLESKIIEISKNLETSVSDC